MTVHFSTVRNTKNKTHLSLEEADEEEDLHQAVKGDLRQGGDAVGAVGEGEARRGGKHAREAEVLCGDVAEDGEHSNAPVLDLHVPEAVEALLRDGRQRPAGKEILANGFS